MLQSDPFQRSANGWRIPVLPSTEKPTAALVEASLQETADRMPPWKQTLGVGLMLHVVPSPCSASVNEPKAEPTAMHAVDVGQATPDRLEGAAVTTVGWLGWTSGCRSGARR